MEIKNVAHIKEASRKIYLLGARNVLIKGGHINQKNNSLDYFFNGKDFKTFSSKRIYGEVHGTGCMLSSAIVSNLCKGKKLKDAIDEAKKFIYKAISSAKKIGKGAKVWI